MILEVAILNIRPGESADFERAFAEAQAIIASMAGLRMGAFSGLLKRISGCGPSTDVESDTLRGRKADRGSVLLLIFHSSIFASCHSPKFWL